MIVIRDEKRRVDKEWKTLWQFTPRHRVEWIFLLLFCCCILSILFFPLFSISIAHLPGMSWQGIHDKGNDGLRSTSCNLCTFCVVFFFSLRRRPSLLTFKIRKWVENNGCPVEGNNSLIITRSVDDDDWLQWTKNQDSEGETQEIHLHVSFTYRELWKYYLMIQLLLTLKEQLQSSLYRKRKCESVYDVSLYAWLTGQSKRRFSLRQRKKTL
jgi:hypothetical protein